MQQTTFTVRPVATIESPLGPGAQTPRQGDEGAPQAWVAFNAEVADAVRDLRAGQDVLLLTWLERADRTVLTVHPRSDPERPLTGVFSTRSPARPNPVGLHRVTILEIADGPRMRVSGLEAWDGTPVIDVKPVLDPHTER
ncbi:tRNA-Thr(GGU) m(6)t(6)A37 methyltransferase TsaA [Streptacidiphilus sp. MAP12-16]|uniref:tRNA (N6-threonylcarbamoyladenosine(37)-N6)-methyltransferase TrmO n=1 Tax=Streptacidiphilus sp. MAP12-16 TaxID=3156300 RepID=UPI003511E9E6